MNVCAIIPARFASSRFPGKPLIDLGGKSMIQRVYEQASKSTRIQTVLVATDSEEIKNHVESFGGVVALTSDEHVTGTSRCNEAKDTLDPKPDLVINVQGDEPCTDPKDLDLLISQFDDAKVDIATLATPLHDAAEIQNPNRVKVVFNNKNDALYFSRAPIPFVRHRVEHIHFLHLGVYAYRTNVLESICLLPESKLEVAESLEQLRWIDAGLTVRLGITNNGSIAIDTLQDVEKVLPYIRALDQEENR